MRLEHVGIAVANLEESNELFAKLFCKNPYKQEDVASENVITSFFQLVESKIELVGSNSETENAISKYIGKKGQGIHHIAFEVDDIYKSMADMKEKGFQLLSETPKQGADNKLICFLHPKTTNGVLVELCQTMK